MTSRTARRILTITASAALLLSAPAFTGIALADNGGGRGSDNNSSSNEHSNSVSAVTLTPAQLTGVQAARNAYITTATAAQDTFEAAVATSKAKARASVAPARTALLIARDAYEMALATTPTDATVIAANKAALEAAMLAYRTASDAARLLYKTEVSAALVIGQGAISAAATTYMAAVNLVFSTSVPAISTPPSLLRPPRIGKGHDGWSNGRGHGGFDRHGSRPRH